MNSKVTAVIIFSAKKRSPGSLEECDISVSKLLGFKMSRFLNFSNFLDSIEFSIEKN